MAQIENAAILHDIGKIAIDDGILNKVEKLSDDEWNKIKDHPSVGAEIAARMKYLEQVSLWIRHHHERVDGKGYPAGLAGDAIPIESKIICVVDAFDAMVGGPAKSDQRPYRLPKTVEEARAGAGALQRIAVRRNRRERVSGDFGGGSCRGACGANIRHGGLHLVERDGCIDSRCRGGSSGHGRRRQRDHGLNQCGFRSSERAVRVRRGFRAPGSGMTLRASSRYSSTHLSQASPDFRRQCR